jgi:hypothetical protein
MTGLKLFGVFTGTELLNDFEFTYKMTVVPNAKYELWCVGAFVQKTVSVKTGVELV